MALPIEGCRHNLPHTIAKVFAAAAVVCADLFVAGPLFDGLHSEEFRTVMIPDTVRILAGMEAEAALLAFAVLLREPVQRNTHDVAYANWCSALHLLI